MKLGAISLGLLAASGLLAVIATIVAAIAAGPTVGGGERAVMAVAVFDLVILLAALAGFWLASGALRAVWRAVALIGFAGLEIVILGFVLFVTLVVLNR